MGEMMGMDVMGKNPTSKNGEYFRANKWSWRPIHALMYIANAEHAHTIVSEETMELMRRTSGAGPDTQKVCDDLAAAMEEVIDTLRVLDKYSVGLVYFSPRKGTAFFTFPVGEKDLVVNKDRYFVNPTGVAEEERYSPYRASLTHVKDFIKFLRECGGFSVC